MGHNILGRLPQRLRWREVISLLDVPSADAAAVAAASTRAADVRLRRLATDETAGYPLWLLTRITWASRGDGFEEQLRALGIEPPADSSAVGLIARVGERTRVEISARRAADQYAEIAAQSLRQALSNTIGREGGSLFASSSEDLQRAVRNYSTRPRFGELARRYFAAFMSRTLRSYVEREIADHVGRDTALKTLAGQRDFQTELDAYVWQASKILEDFAGDWYAKHNWESKGEISPEETQRFLAYALRKLRGALRRGEGA